MFILQVGRCGTEPYTKTIQMNLTIHSASVVHVSDYSM